MLLTMAEWPKADVQACLDLFTDGLWDAFVGESVGGLMAGQPNEKPAECLLGQLHSTRRWHDHVRASWYG